MLVMPRYEEEWKRKIETARDNAAAAATELLKSKLAEAAEKERRRLESESTFSSHITGILFVSQNSDLCHCTAEFPFQGKVWAKCAVVLVCPVVRTPLSASLMKFKGMRHLCCRSHWMMARLTSYYLLGFTHLDHLLTKAYEFDLPSTFVHRWGLEIIICCPIHISSHIPFFFHFSIPIIPHYSPFVPFSFLMNLLRLFFA